MYVDCRGNILQTSPDPLAGLYIKSRNGKIHHVSIPSDSLAFQVGETTQIHSGGLLQATPHSRLQQPKRSDKRIAGYFHGA
mmetsp:Transcript_27452/g.39310  ORF Transcript_27452/g.39310 Transcript_27452/m.39310 type:complete len:81 (-) Transcript_27452:327-569(-)